MRTHYSIKFFSAVWWL